MRGIVRACVAAALLGVALCPAGAAGRPPAPDEGAAPEAPQEEELSRADLLDGLLARLHLAGEDAPEAQAVAKAVLRLWSRSGSASADFLIVQAARALKAGDAQTALRILDLVVWRWPAFAEGWRRRALARHAAGDPEGALEDLNETLAREPRHFRALFMKGVVLEELKRPAEAAAAYEEALSVYPGFAEARRALKDLRLRTDQPV